MARYANVTYEGALAMPCDMFALARKHEFIERMQETEEGRQYLRDCERLATTTPDLAALRRMKGYKAEVRS